MTALLVLLRFYVTQYNGWSMEQQESEVERKPYETGHFLVWVNPLDLLFIWIIVPPFLGTMREKLIFRVNFPLPYKTGHFGLGESS